MARNPLEMDEYDGKGYDSNSAYPDLIQQLRNNARTTEKPFPPTKSNESVRPVSPSRKIKNLLAGTGGYAIED